MKWIVDNWSLLVVILAALVVAYHYLKKFAGLPSEAQQRKIREVLLFWVIEAEKTFKGGTGAIKLRWVYDKFLERFPQFAGVVPFELFAKWVDDALVEMRHLLETNLNVFYYVNDDGVE